MRDMVDARYRIEQKLAVGGFGTIYRATDTVIGRQVALKILHRELAGDANVVARFRREVAALAKLKSSNTLTLYDVGETDDTLYFVMELLRGESLYDVFSRTGPLAWRRLAGIARGVCSSLREAHAFGIVHRDLKPDNIFLEKHALDVDHVKVLDFGIAKVLATSDLENRDLTRHGQMIGTFDYMAPEQMIGAECTSKSDVFTLGVVLYEMLTGARPYGHVAGPAQMLMALMTQSPTPLTGVPFELSRAIMKCLAREPGDRPDVDQLDAMLTGLLEIDENAFGDADEPTLIVAQSPRPSRPLAPPADAVAPAPLRARPARPTTRGSSAAIHGHAEPQMRGRLPSVMIARDALTPIESPRPVQGTPVAGTPSANPRTMTAPAADDVAAHAPTAQQAAVTRSSMPSRVLVARGSEAALARGSHEAIARDIELALASTLSSEAYPDAFLAQGTDAVAPARQASVIPVPRLPDVGVRFAPTPPLPAAKSRLAAGTSPIESEEQIAERDHVIASPGAADTRSAAERAIALPTAPGRPALAAVRYVTLAACLFGLGFLGALTIWSL